MKKKKYPEKKIRKISGLILDGRSFRTPEVFPQQNVKCELLKLRNWIDVKTHYSLNLFFQNYKDALFDNH